MIETKNVEIDGIKFQIQQFPAMKSIKLDAKTLTLLSPLVKMLKGFKNIDSEIDASYFGEAIRDVLVSLNEDELENYINKMVEYTFAVYSEDGKTSKPIQLTNRDVFNSVFAGKNLVLYKLLFEVMKVNGFSFFGFLGGSQINITDIFNKIM